MKQSIKIIPVLIVNCVFIACNQPAEKQAAPPVTEITESKKQIAAMLDSFNVAAANAEYDRYFNFFTHDATFNGTDATENWDKASYMAWAKPYFDKKTTWNFKALKRNIYFGKYADMAWFEELLSTQMKICRGSGVLVKQDGSWKVQQYVLSAAIPNSQLDKVIALKAAEEDSLMQILSKTR